MTFRQPSVLVYNPLSGHGHLDSWCAMFVSILLAGGYRVLAVTPDSAGLRQRLSNDELNQALQLEILEWDVLNPSFTSRAISKLIRNLQRFRIRIVSGVLKHVIPDSAMVTDGMASSNLSDPELNYIEPADFILRIQRAMRFAKFKPDLVLNMYMDLYRTDVSHWQAAQAKMGRLPFAWIGLRFIPRTEPSEAYYKIDSLRGVCLLDQGVVDKYRQLLPEKIYAYLPDITHADLPAQASERSNKIKALADGRRIVFMGGTIGATKNLAKWFELVKRADVTQWFFVQIGEVHAAALNKEDLVAYEQLISEARKNLYVETSYLPDERAFNEIIAMSDVLFAVYRDFKISSNMLGKAAVFEKPILVADNYLMGERVLHYGLGKTVSQDDVEQMLVALTELVSNATNQAGCAAYRDDFGREALSKQLFSMLNNCYDSGQPERIA